MYKKRVILLTATTLVAAALAVAAAKIPVETPKPVAAPAPGVAKIAQSAQAKLAAYAKGAKASTKTLRVCYFIPKGRDGAKDYLVRTQGIILDFQTWLTAEMKRNGFAGKTLRLELDKAGKPLIHIVRGERKIDEYDYKEGQAIRTECAAVLKKAGIADVNDETLLILQDMMFEPKPEAFTQKAPYYGGGSFRCGTAWCTDCRVLSVENLLVSGPKTWYQRGSMVRGQYNSTMIGGMLHELGHALQLPHNKESKTEKSTLGTALMGAGNYTFGRERWTNGKRKGSFLTFASAMRLASHPLFAGIDKGRAIDPVAQINTKFDHPAGKRTLTVHGQVKSANVPVYAIVIYTDLAGHGDYNARTTVGALDDKGNFSVTVTDIADGDYEVRVTFCHANGGVSHQVLKYTCKDGSIAFKK
ncbi:MAG: hypothetical protein HN909_06260 [Phycisphaerales bacterium]|jgi:hypothetical protein|nr:hypothetical protein [Phycisphaerales bacterium]MBT7171356.1 hypothetical protein [Phycisphaerales bacterium]